MNQTANKPTALRPSLNHAVSVARERIAAPGTWLSGATRVAIAAQTRHAKHCSLCQARNDALSPNMVNGEHDDRANLAGELSPAMIDVVHRLVNDSGRLSEKWLQEKLADGLTEEEYVEIIGIVATQVGLDTLNHALGEDSLPLLDAQAGEPSRQRPFNARKDLAWVSTLSPQTIGDDDPPIFARHGAVNIHRAISLVPQEVVEASRAFWTALIEGDLSAPAVMAPYLEGCGTDPNEGLTDTVPADFVAWSGSGSLRTVVPAARANTYSAPPPLTIDPQQSYEAVLATGGGEIRIRLLADTAPITVNSFVNLARDGYYDGTTFHRVLAGFMAQGGDPTGLGTGGPGYTFTDEFEGGPPLDRAGLLAMANSGPNTNGSQFFLTFAAADYLTGAHTVFGEVVEGQDVLNAITLRDPAAPQGRGQVLDLVTIIEG